MDEIFGFFPAVSNPPSKKPMLLLLKQARAYGVSIILATQNPIDLDYKGLSNIGTWFIGRLQTKQDKERVMDGLLKNDEDSLDKKEIENLLSNIKSRVFLFKSAHEDQLKLMQTRWVLSYLRGPLSKKEIRTLMAEKKTVSSKERKSSEKAETGVADSNTKETNIVRSVISGDIEQYYTSAYQSYGKEIVYEPYLAARGKVKFVNTTRGIDTEKSLSKRYYLDDTLSELDFDGGEEYDFDIQLLDKRPAEHSRFYDLPTFIKELKNLKPLEKAFADYLYRNNKMELYRCKALKVESKPGESLRDFKVRLMDILRDKKDEAVEKIRAKYKTKGDRLQDKYERLLLKLEKEKADVSAKKTDTAVSIGMAILGSFLGSRSRSSYASSISKAGRISKEKADVKRVEEEIARVEQDIKELQSSLEYELETLDEKFDIEQYQIDKFYIKPRRSDIYDVDVVLLWEAK